MQEKNFSESAKGKYVKNQFGLYELKIITTQTLLPESNPKQEI